MNNLAEELAKFVIQTKWEDLPAAVIHNVKLLFLDSIGCAMAALSVDPGKMAVALAEQLGGPPESTIIGTSCRVSCTNAAFANGELIRAMDYDAMPVGGHTPPYVIPPALAIAEKIEATGRDFILAAALGFEIAARVSRGVQGGGFSFTGTDVKSFKVGDRGGGASFNFGAAAGVGKLLKLDRPKMVNALGMAGHLCQVLTNTRFTFGAHRHMAKYGIAGWQNTGGVMAALLADMGYMGDTGVFDDYGFQTFCGYGGWQPENVTEGLGQKWFVSSARFKRYPICGMIHTALDCFYSLIEKHNIMPDDIESVKVYDHPILQSPLFTNRELTNIVDIQFGPHYALALAACGVKPGPDWQDLKIVRNPKIINLAGKISILPHPDFARQNLKDPSSHLSRVEITAGGRTCVEERTHSRGIPDPEYALTEEEIIEKFRQNASRVLPQDRINGVPKAVLEMEKTQNITLFTQQTTL